MTRQSCILALLFVLLEIILLAPDYGNVAPMTAGFVLMILTAAVRDPQCVYTVSGSGVQCQDTLVFFIHGHRDYCTAVCTNSRVGPETVMVALLLLRGGGGG